MSNWTKPSKFYKVTAHPKRGLGCYASREYSTLREALHFARAQRKKHRRVTLTRVERLAYIGHLP